MSAETTTSSAIAPARSVSLLRQYWPWLAAMVAALLLPWLFFDWSKGRHSGFVLTMLSEIGLMSVFALSFNMQMGQTGLLSFGHAILFGLGGYCTAHALNAVKAGALWLPVELVPLVGGLGGLVFGAAFGYVATKQRATAFAMITLGIGELVAAMSLMFPGFFGGEGGVTTNRVYGKGMLGLTFGSQLQVYYLVAVYCFVSTALMFALTKTPLGRMLNAVRDNPERVEFIGYNTQRVRYIGFIIAGFFAGIGGALATINFEIVNASDGLSALRSGGYLLFTFLGGATFFFGPMIGAVLLVLASVLLSEALTISKLIAASAPPIPAKKPEMMKAR